MINASAAPAAGKPPDSMTLAELRAALDAVGVKSTGPKLILVDRLETVQQLQQQTVNVAGAGAGAGRVGGQSPTPRQPDDGDGRVGGQSPPPRQPDDGDGVPGGDGDGDEDGDDAQSGEGLYDEDDIFG